MALCDHVDLFLPHYAIIKKEGMPNDIPSWLLLFLLDLNQGPSD